MAFDCEQNLAIHDLERRLRQGKLSFASEQRMERWLGLRPGSVSPFGLINDPERHVHLFLDRNLERFPAYSFHPNDNRATVVVSRQRVPALPRRRRQYVRIHRTLLTPSCAAAIAADEKLPVPRHHPRQPRRSAARSFCRRRYDCRNSRRCSEEPTPAQISSGSAPPCAGIHYL